MTLAPTREEAAQAALSARLNDPLVAGNNRVVLWQRT